LPLNRISFPQNYEAIEQDRDIDLGNFTLSLFQAKGHSPGNLVAHVPELHALFTSDSLGFHYPGRDFCPLYFTGLTNYLATLDKLSLLKPEIVCPGHQGPIIGLDVPVAFSMATETANKIHRYILKSSQGREGLADKLFSRFYKDEFKIYGESNIRNCMHLLIKRSWEAIEAT
jgi:glyoxylase-like metal-dependent hydrolase (beta-lactamase superfamily II)